MEHIFSLRESMQQKPELSSHNLSLKEKTFLCLKVGTGADPILLLHEIGNNLSHQKVRNGFSSFVQKRIHFLGAYDGGFRRLSHSTVLIGWCQLPATLNVIQIQITIRCFFLQRDIFVRSSNRPVRLIDESVPHTRNSSTELLVDDLLPGTLHCFKNIAEWTIVGSLDWS